MTTLLEVGEFEHEGELAKPPLKAMLGQVRFPVLLRVNDTNRLAAFHEAIVAEFPEIREEQNLRLEISPNSSSQKTEDQYRFVDPDERWSLVLNRTSFALEANADKYTSFERFIELFELAWRAFVPEFAPTRIEHQGLRYIDHIEKDLTGTQWAEYIRPELLGASATIFGDKLKQSMTNLVTEMPKGTLSFNHGIVQGGPENRSGYLLDTDYFVQGDELDVEPEGVVSTFREFHDELYGLFRWCVTEKAMNEFRQQ